MRPDRLQRIAGSLRYEGFHILLWRALVKCVSPLGYLGLLGIYQKDLTQPLKEAQARVKVAIMEVTERDIDRLMPLALEAGWASSGGTELGPARILHTRSEMLDRFQRGSKCFVAQIDGEIVHFNWISFTQMEWLMLGPHATRLADGEAYTMHAYTARAWRGKGIHTAVLSTMLRFLKAAGCSRAYTQVGLENRSSWKTHERLRWSRSGVLLYFIPRGAETAWIWRLLGTLAPFQAHRRRFLCVSPVRPPRGS